MTPPGAPLLPDRVPVFLLLAAMAAPSALAGLTALTASAASAAFSVPAGQGVVAETEPPRQPQPPGEASAARSLSGTARRLQEDLPPDASEWAELEAAGPFWRARLRFAAAADAISDRDRRADEAVRRLPEGTLLGLPGLETLLLLRAEILFASAPSARAHAGEALLVLAERSAAGPVARAALGDASLLVDEAAQRRRLREAAERLLPAGLPGTRAGIRRALVLSRASSPAGTDAAPLAALADLAVVVPDAPERAGDLFTPQEVRLFSAAVARAPLSVRVARARTLVKRHSDEAAALVLHPVGPLADRVDAAEVLLLSGRTRESSQEVARLLSAAPSADQALRLRSLEVSASLRTLRAAGAPTGEGRKTKKRGGTRRPVATSDAGARRSGWERASSAAEALLAAPLGEADRRRLLVDLSRAGISVGEAAAALRHAAALVAIDPSSTAGAAEFFDATFARYRAGGFGEAARLWGSAAATWSDATVRRRATYWQARATLKGGDEAGSSPLFASLASGTAADLWGRWSAARLGISFSERGPQDQEGEGGLAPLSSVAAGSAERELLACGLPEMAEEEAETSRGVTPLLLAATASARGDHRRAAGILKSQWPSLGTSEEGDVPTAVRRAFYPAAHRERLEGAARSFGIPPALLFGLVRQESVFSAAIVSRAGAVGLTQVMPATGRALHRQEGGTGRPDLSNPDQNVRLGARYLGEMLRLFGGDAVLALSAYNAGPGRAARWRREMASLAADEFVESIPLSETRDYVRRVLFYEASYGALWGLESTVSPRGGSVSPGARVRSPW